MILNVNEEHKHIISHGLDSNGWHYEKYSDGTYKAYQDKEETLTTTASTDEVLRFVQYAQIVAISTNPVFSTAITNYNVEIVKTSSYGWLAKMSGGIKTAFRYFTYNANNINVNITTRHFIEGRWQ